MNTIKNIAVTGISEIHCKTTGHITIINGNLVISSSNEQNSINGIAIIINKYIKITVLNYNILNDRIMSVKLQIAPVNINIVQVYTAISTTSEEEIDHFMISY